MLEIDSKWSMVCDQIAAQIQHDTNPIPNPTEFLREARGRGEALKNRDAEPHVLGAALKIMGQFEFTPIALASKLRIDLEKVKELQQKADEQIVKKFLRAFNEGVFLV